MAEEHAAVGGGFDALAAAGAGIGGAVGMAVGMIATAEKALSDLGSSVGSAQKFEVDKETVLQAGRIVSDQADKLRLAASDARRDLRIDLRNADEVNASVAEAWNSRLVTADNSYNARVGEYVDSLDGLAEQLRAAAKTYGYTDEEISQFFGKQNSG
ncbi:hypothetical protein [Umezawaea beigongshangensis]|uniref:hypothetical protein n=1 Tax=Umezawaea beigongshangensis TaxID=2780383 RepID=UPI0018F110B4|nr:hypothetical protein [Umezawaea beigongshangensis]